MTLKGTIFKQRAKTDLYEETNITQYACKNKLYQIIIYAKQNSYLWIIILK